MTSTQTIATERKFPQPRIYNQMLTYRFLLLEPENLSIEVYNRLEKRGWVYINDACSFTDTSIDTPSNNDESLRYKHALIHITDPLGYNKAWADLRESVGMPRFEEFGPIEQVNISLTLPHAMKSALPEVMVKALEEDICNQIRSYIVLGQKAVEISFFWHGKTTETNVAVIVTGRQYITSPVISGVSAHPEWQQCIRDIKNIVSVSRMQAIRTLEYDQTLDIPEFKQEAEEVSI